MSHGGCEEPPQAPDLVPACAKHWEARGTRRGAGQTVSALQRKGCITHLGTRLLRAQVTPPPVPSPLTTSRQDRGQGGGLSFILRPQQVETEEAAAVFPRVFPDGAGREGRWRDGVGRQKAEAASQGSTGLGGFRPRPRTASCPRPSREAWEEGTDSLGWGWDVTILKFCVSQK